MRTKLKDIKRTLTIILCLIYIISPIDLIPEIFLGPLGFVDDGAVFIKLITALLFG